MVTSPGLRPLVDLHQGGDMMHKIVFGGILAIIGLFLSSSAFAQNDAPAAVEKSAQALDAWLGTGTNGKIWRDYLLLKKLIAETTGDREANPAVLVEVWRRFTSGEAGLEGTRFQQVRQDLEHYLNERLHLSRSQVAALAKDAADYAPPTPQEIAQAETALKQAIAQLNATLGRMPRAKGDVARKYLGAQTLQGLATGKQVDSVELDALATRLGKYHWRIYDKQYVDLVPALKFRNETKVEGLEGAAYGRVRTALNRVRDLRTAADDKDGKAAYQASVEDLVKHLDAAAKLVGENPKPAAITEKEDPLPLPPIALAAEALARLQASGQGNNSGNKSGSKLAQEAVTGFSLPNLVAYTSRDFLGGGLEQEINRTQPVNDNILGTSVYGTARVVGETDVKMLTNPQQAGYQIFLNAVARSNTVGYNGPVTIFSTGVTQLHGQKKIHFDDDIGGMIPAPATATAATSTTINNVCARSRLVTRIAWKRVMGSKSQAEAIASGNAAARLRGEMDTQATSSTRQANINFQEKYRRPLLIRGEYPRQFVTASSSHLMQIAISQLGNGQLGAPDVPPAAPAADLAVQLHESYVSNFARAMLGGQEFTSLDLRQMQERMGGKVKSVEELAQERAAKSGEDTPPNIPETIESLADTFITFDDDMPVRVEFRDNQVLIVVRTKKLESRVENEDPKAPEERLLLARRIEISALYQVVQEGDSTVLKRDPIGVNTAFLDPVAKDEDANRRRLGKRRITDRFREDVFPAEMKLGPLDFSKGQSNKKAFGNWSSMPAMPVEAVKSAAGWFSIGWSLPEVPVKTPEKKSEQKKSEPKKKAAEPAV